MVRGSNKRVLDEWLEELEVVGALERALQEKKAEFDRLVDSEKTADLNNAFFVETVTRSSAAPSG